MKPEPIIFRQEMKDGEAAVYVAQEWPQCTVISPGALRNILQVSINDDGLIVITCANGSATYRLAKEQTDDHGITIELTVGSFSEPPSILQECSI